MQLSVHHETVYRFSKPLEGVIQLLRLTPLSCISQNVLDWRIDVGCDARLRESRDGYGNVTHMLYVDQPVDLLTLSATGRVLTEDTAGVVQGLPGDLPSPVFLRPTPLTQPDDALQDLAAAAVLKGGTDLEKLHRLNSAIHGRMKFDTASSHSATTAAEAYAARRGVCQDFAHIFIAVARMAGLPARYVSGHMFRGPDEPGQDAGHAWGEAWVPDLGWVAFDPGSGLCADDRYVRVAHGLDYREAAPIVGERRGGGTEEMSVKVQVSEIVRRSQSQSQSQAGPGGSQAQSQSQDDHIDL